MLGNAAFRTEKWPTSIKAFKSCTNLDPDVREEQKTIDNHLKYFFFKSKSNKIIELPKLEQSSSFIYKDKPEKQSLCSVSRGAQIRLRELEDVGEFSLGI